ncbi:MAG: HupE/UreJ family protein [Candidatus Kapabacteria bacterium]|jgi:hypothetical protein|nr:HupE/UreJ family protein [Candidatus Kapabacteria bacterium]
MRLQRHGKFWLLVRGMALFLAQTAFIQIIFIQTALVNTPVSAHPMPNSMVTLDIGESSIHAVLSLPLMELERTFGQNLTANPREALVRYRTELERYCLQHTSARTSSGEAWSIAVEQMTLDSSTTALNGQFYELRVTLGMNPPVGASVRDLVWNYDAILHHIVTHTALVLVRQDWGAGLIREESSQGDSVQAQEIGTIAWDIRSNTLAPFILPKQESSLVRGFGAMLRLGMTHISEGIDHLLFLLVLLLPAPLLVEPKGWGAFGGTKYALVRLLKTISAFTLGHSLTLLLGALGFTLLSARFVESAIVLSIIVSGFHAIRPFAFGRTNTGFWGRESWIAAGFGLIHGLAFAETLQNLQLGAMRLVISIAGFNVGIECMQMAIILCIVPFLLLLAQTRFYAVFRVAVAVIALLAAFAWGIERWTEQATVITPLFTHLFQTPLYYGLLWLIFALSSVLLWWNDGNRKGAKYA